MSRSDGSIWGRGDGVTLAGASPGLAKSVLPESVVLARVQSLTHSPLRWRVGTTPRGAGPLAQTARSAPLFPPISSFRVIGAHTHCAAVGDGVAKNNRSPFDEQRRAARVLLAGSSAAHRAHDVHWLTVPGGGNVMLQHACATTRA